MSFNILTGGAAGQGIETLSAIFEKILKLNGFNLFVTKDYMSRVRGGHNFVTIRFGSERLVSHLDDLDGIITLNDESIETHVINLKTEGFVVCDEGISYKDERLIKLPLKTIAKDAGNVKAEGSAALGAVLGLFGIDMSGIDSVFFHFFKSEVAEINIKAMQEGYKLTQRRYMTADREENRLPVSRKQIPDGITQTPDGGKQISENGGKTILINGNEAVALGAIAAGCKFYSAYPMTPSTSIMDYLASKMHDAEIVVEQAEDEIAAINMAIGASYAGVRAMTGTSGGGFSLMVEALGLSAMLEVPLVIAEVQRPGPATGFPTRTEQGDLKFVISASHGEFPRMVIALKSPEDAFYKTVRAFNIADKYRIPVILLSDQFLSDSNTTISPFDIDEAVDDKPQRDIPGKTPGKVFLVDSDEHDETGHITESAQIRNLMVEKRMEKLRLLENELNEPEFTGAEDFEVLFIAWGSAWGPVTEALGMLNENTDRRYAALIFGDVWPLPVKLLKSKAAKAKRIVNIEQNATGQLASIVAEKTGIFCDFSILKFDGRPMSPQYIYDKMREVGQTYVK